MKTVSTLSLSGETPPWGAPGKAIWRGPQPLSLTGIPQKPKHMRLTPILVYWEAGRGTRLLFHVEAKATWGKLRLCSQVQRKASMWGGALAPM